MKNTKKRFSYIVSGISFLISLIGIVVLLKIENFYPFGEKTLFVMDMQDQYVGFFASLRYLLSGDLSLFFSWSRSMGGNFLGVFAYYLASPLSFITTFFALEDMPLAITVLTILKIALCGLTFSVYANYLYQNYGTGENAKDTAEPRYGQLVVVPISVSYALMSYNITYMMCLMWLDGVIFLPLVMLGIEKILAGERGGIYFGAFTGLIFCNYYTAYMVGLFSGLYMLYRSLSLLVWTDIKASVMQGVQFVKCTLLSLGCSAPILLPVIIDLFNGRFTEDTLFSFDEKFNYKSYTALIEQFRWGAYKSLDNDGMPAIYCGIIAFFLAVCFFFGKKINIREKVGAFGALLFFSVSFYFLPLDLIWHGFQRTASFPYRYAFLFCFTIFYMAIRIVCSISWGKLNRTLRCILWSFAVLVVIVDLGVNGKIVLSGIENQYKYDARAEYTEFIAKTKPLVIEIQNYDKDLYRINQCYEYSKNDALLLGYHGMTHYSSAFNSAINTLTSKLGLAQIHFWNSGYGSTPLTDDLFGIRYIVAMTKQPTAYQQIGNTSFNTASYRNEDALAFLYSAPVVNLEPQLDMENPFTNQNNLLNAISGTEENYFSVISHNETIDEKGWNYTFTAQSNNPVYFYLDTTEYSYDEPKTVYVDGTPIGKFFTSETKCVLFLGEFVQGTAVNVSIPDQEMAPNSITIAELDLEKLSETVSELKKGEMTIQKQRGRTIEGYIAVEENEKILTSIPYDKGWKVMVDGQNVQPLCFANTFLCIPVTAGMHEVTLSYISPGFKSGIVIFMLSIVWCIACFFKSRDKKV